MKLAAVYASCLRYFIQRYANAYVMRRTGKKVETARDHPAAFLQLSDGQFWRTSYKWRGELKQRHSGLG